MTNTARAKRLSNVKFIDDTMEITAIVARLNVLDYDNDYTERGAFGRQEVAIAGWGHKWDVEPNGRGVVYEQGDLVLYTGRFFDHPDARKAYETIKAMSLPDPNVEGSAGIQEFSYGYYIKEAGFEVREIDGMGPREVYVLKKLDVFEISPVYRGAGIGTGTIDIKAAEKHEVQPAGDAGADTDNTIAIAKAQAAAFQYRYGQYLKKGD